MKSLKESTANLRKREREHKKWRETECNPVKTALYQNPGKPKNCGINPAKRNETTEKRNE